MRGRGRRTRSQEVARKANDDERQQDGEDVPSQQQGDAGLDEQLAEAAFLHEDDHAVEGQHHAKEVDHRFVSGHVVEVEEVVGRERQQRRRECDPSVGCEAEEREIREDCGSGEEHQHEDSDGVELIGRAPSKGQGGQLDDEVAADGEAVVGPVAGDAVVVYGPAREALEAVFWGNVHRYHEVMGRYRVVAVSSVEVSSVAAEHEYRRQRQ